MVGGGFFEDDYEPTPVPQQRGVLSGPGSSRQLTQEDDFDAEGNAALEEIMWQEQGSSTDAPSSSANAEDADTEYAGVPKPVFGKCIDCREREGQQKFFDAFGVNACYNCQKAAKGAGGKYQVLTKSKAKDEYLLTDRQLSKEQGGLGCMTLPNPHKSSYGDMRLYLRTQVEELALRTWGSDEALFVEKERRVQERLQKADAKKRKAATTGPRGIPAGAAKRSAASTAAFARYQQQQAVHHTHSFCAEADEVYDEAADTWTKTCTVCGFEVTYERI